MLEGLARPVRNVGSRQGCGILLDERVDGIKACCGKLFGNIERAEGLEAAGGYKEDIIGKLNQQIPVEDACGQNGGIRKIPSLIQRQRVLPLVDLRFLAPHKGDGVANQADGLQVVRLPVLGGQVKAWDSLCQRIEPARYRIGFAGIVNPQSLKRSAVIQPCSPFAQRPQAVMGDKQEAEFWRPNLVEDLRVQIPWRLHSHIAAQADIAAQGFHILRRHLFIAEEITLSRLLPKPGFFFCFGRVCSRGGCSRCRCPHCFLSPMIFGHFTLIVR